MGDGEMDGETESFSSPPGGGVSVAPGGAEAASPSVVVLPPVTPATATFTSGSSTCSRGEDTLTKQPVCVAVNVYLYVYVCAWIFMQDYGCLNCNCVCVCVYKCAFVCVFVFLPVLSH